MAYESARMMLGSALERLQKGIISADIEIKEHETQLAAWQQKREELKAETKDVADALNQLGGPVPDWTEDKALIAFWDEINE